MSHDTLLASDTVGLLVKAMEALTCGILITDHNGIICWSNAGLSRMTGYSAEELHGQSTAIFHSGMQDAVFYHDLWSTILAGDTWRGTVANRRKDGSSYYADELIMPIFEASGGLSHFVALQLDLAPAGEIEVEQRWLAYHDSLTRLPNRARFMECLRQSIADGIERNSLFSVMFLDLDRFKPVNDRYGHHIGDLLLQAIANRMRAALRRTDIIARLGGDEFTVIARNLREPGQGRVLAQKIIDSLIRPFRLEHHLIEVGVSVGVAEFPADGCDGEGLLECADMAMYSAKAAGGSRLCLYRDLPPKHDSNTFRPRT